MPEFKLIVNEGGAMILDQEGQAVDSTTALALLDQLHQHYERPACVYVFYHASKRFYKIGMTSRPVKVRLSQIRYEEDSHDINLVHVIQCGTTRQAADLEYILHSIFNTLRIRGEWFHISVADVERLKTVSHAVEAISALLPYWHEEIEKRSYARYSAREEAVYQRCRAWLDY